MVAFIIIALVVIITSLTPAPTVNNSHIPTSIRQMEGYSVDSNGTTYYEVNGKRVDTKTGTTLRETSGGYINTKDGDFVPKVGE
jgi:hypothetical protein